MAYQLFCREICPLINSSEVSVEEKYKNEIVRRRTFNAGVNNIIPFINVYVPENLKNGINLPEDMDACPDMVHRYGFALKRNLGGESGDIKCPFADDIFATGGSEKPKNNNAAL
ncbi:MAG: hypothetical protein WC784_01100 [Candidatus Shapirobacteria bacterium]|jgi:hypothetical protein